MIELMISTFLKDFNVVMLVAAVLLAVVSSRLRVDEAGGFANQLLGWLLLLSVGAQGVYTFIIHVFFPSVSAANIGWAESPFQYEVGIADLTVGVLSVLAFWGNFSFRLAAAIAGIVWYWGDAVGHVRQMVVANYLAPGNAGPWFWTDVLVPFLLVACVVVVWRRQSSASSA